VLDFSNVAVIQVHMIFIIIDESSFWSSKSSATIDRRISFPS